VKVHFFKSWRTSLAGAAAILAVTTTAVKDPAFVHKPEAWVGLAVGIIGLFAKDAAAEK
jgi:hypothetical protein